jgi:hemerythrin-like domain-containing protein
MEAIDILYQEHEKILLQLLSLEELLSSAKSVQNIPVDQLESYLIFLTEFADTRHHGKEELILFPQLETAGLSKQHGPIGVMLHEHGLGRACIASMKNSLNLLKAGNHEVMSNFIASATEYIELLRNHIKKENNILFPMAKKVLNPTQINLLNEEFNSFENNEVETGRDARMLQLIEELKIK